MGQDIGPWISWSVASPIPTRFEKRIKVALLDFVEIVPYLLAGVLPHALNHLPHLVLGRLDDGLDVSTLNRGEVQFRIQSVQKLLAENLRLLGLGREGTF